MLRSRVTLSSYERPFFNPFVNLAVRFRTKSVNSSLSCQQCDNGSGCDILGHDSFVPGRLSFLPFATVKQTSRSPYGCVKYGKLSASHKAIRSLACPLLAHISDRPRLDGDDYPLSSDERRVARKDRDDFFDVSKETIR
jgi:hypothetical protein